MNTITTDNYEAYIIDFVENTLSDEQNAEMLSLLNLHPDIADEVLQFRNLKITPEADVVFDHKAALFRTESRWIRFRPYMIAASLLLVAGAAAWFVSIPNTTDKVQYAIEEPGNMAPQKNVVMPEIINEEVESAEGPDVIIANVEQVEELKSSNVITSTPIQQKAVEQENDIRVSQPMQEVYATVEDPISSIPVSIVTLETTIASETLTADNELLSAVAKLETGSLHLLTSEEKSLPALTMELRELNNRMRYLFPSNSQFAISSLASTLFPSIASEEIQFLPDNLEDIEVQLLPTYVKERIN